MADNWLVVTKDSPPDDLLVMTKIDDENGPRNVQALIRIKRLWWHPDKKMHTYYEPTHWQSIE